MKSKNGVFDIESVERNYVRSASITGTRNPPPSLPAGVTSIALRCRSCGHQWVAWQGQDVGSLVPFIGGGHVKCANCETPDTIDLRGINR